MVSPPTGDYDDIVADILRRFALRMQTHVEAFAELEVQIRREWGGERCYVAKHRNDPAARAYRTHRDMQIIADLGRGERVELISRRYGISVRRVEQIKAAAGG